MQSRFAKANQQMTVDWIDSFAFGVLFLLPLENCLKKQGSTIEFSR